MSINDPAGIEAPASGADGHPYAAVLVSTTWNVAGHRVNTTLGEVFGLTVRSRGLFQNIAASIRSMFGGEVRFYTNLLERSQQEAIERMLAKARALGANAVLSMRFDASQLSTFMTEVVAYGTAAVIEPDPQDHPTLP
jgi:uncharacterized protein YbjQ (UPF0145 family)